MKSRSDRSLLHLEEEHLERRLARVLEGMLGEGWGLHRRRDAGSRLDVNGHGGSLVAIRVDGDLVALEDVDQVILLGSCRRGSSGGKERHSGTDTHDSASARGA